MKKLLAAALAGSLLAFAPSAEARNLGERYFETSEGCFKSLEYRDWVPSTRYRSGHYRYGSREVRVPCRRYTHTERHHHHYHGGYYRPFHFSYGDSNSRFSFGW